MRRLLLIAFLVVLSKIGQGQTTGAGFVIYASSAPSGTCSAGAYLEQVIGLGTVYSCQSGTWTQVGSGAGTVSSFSAGTLSPLFTTSVATATTTPALTFALSSAAANTVLGNATSSSAAPTFTASPSVASVVVNGATSGSATVSASATGGTLNLGSTNATVTSAGALTVASCTGCGGATTESHTASTSSSLDFTTCLVSANNARIDISNLILATDSADLNFLVSTNGGSSYDNTAAHYAQADGYNTGGNGGQGGAASQALINLTDTASSGVKAIANTGYSGSFTLFGPGGSVFKELAGVATYKRGFDSNAITLHVGGFYLQTTAVNAFRIIASSGNLTSGTVYCTPLD